MALAAYRDMRATRRCSPGRMRSPASSARSNLPGIRSTVASGSRGSENSTQGQVAVEDRQRRSLDPARTSEAQVGGKDPSEDHLGAQLGSGAGVQLEVAAVERERVAHI